MIRPPARVGRFASPVFPYVVRNARRVHYASAASAQEFRASMKEPIGYATLGDLQRERYRIYSRCRACEVEERVFIGDLIPRLGSDYPIMAGLRLHCSKCGGGDVAVTVRAYKPAL
jgi:hypothetical protein